MKILWNHSELLLALKDDLINTINNKDLKISEVAIDGRKPIKDSLFVALKGENTDGHNYLQQAVDSGAVALLVNRIPKEAENLKATFIVVADTYKALYSLATFSRNRSSAKIIAVTGSVGKTGTKEMLKIALVVKEKPSPIVAILIIILDYRFHFVILKKIASLQYLKWA